MEDGVEGAVMEAEAAAAAVAVVLTRFASFYANVTTILSQAFALGSASSIPDEGFFGGVFFLNFLHSLRDFNRKTC